MPLEYLVVVSWEDRCSFLKAGVARGKLFLLVVSTDPEAPAPPAGSRPGPGWGGASCHPQEEVISELAPNLKLLKFIIFPS